MKQMTGIPWMLMLSGVPGSFLIQLPNWLAWSPARMPMYNVPSVLEVAKTWYIEMLFYCSLLMSAASVMEAVIVLARFCLEPG